MLLGTWFVQVVTVMVMVMVMVMVTMVVLMKTMTALTVLTGRSRRLYPNAARGQHIIHRALTCNDMYIIHLQRHVYNTQGSQLQEHDTTSSNTNITVKLISCTRTRTRTRTRTSKRQSPTMRGHPKSCAAQPGAAPASGRRPQSLPAVYCVVLNKGGKKGEGGRCSSQGAHVDDSA